METTIRIEEDRKSKIEKVLLTIARDIIKKSTSSSLGLLSGKMGETLFLHEYSKHNKDYEGYVAQNIDDIFESVENGNVFHTYCNGLAGMCLGINYIESERDPEHESFGFVDPQIHEWLHGQLQHCIEENDYDFLHGAVGIGFYFLERYKAGDFQSEKSLESLLKFLNDSEIRNQDTIKWKNTEGIVNISLSHGMSSIILFLVEVYKSDFQSRYDIAGLIEGAVNFVLTQEIDPEKYGSYYPSASLQVEGQIYKSRLAWCYGDLGVAIMLRKASETFNQPLWKEKSAAIFQHAATRRNKNETTVMDAGLCHGSAGVFLIFYKEFLKTGHTLYAEAAQLWLNKTLEFYDEDPLHFSRVSYNSTTNAYTESSCLLDGTSGVGLALLLVLQNKSDWSKFLLV
ncbi:lanthionine synthetase LanC family protein [Chryseobacterium sp. PMSZPI]|uniref:lanthionine synthetase LanC family protein n=1 Tax=Chryseobacterium sp. PMSZPI TaxID=1033900 RepID=UPI000C33F833|nr:lanthionine synthetase LanC family protein [Chryseobacterium sp. PMSZPI]PKF75849.1 hypothetical protein CW752_02045 [Chryseobacterium sp. PMSZPI]